MSLSLNPERRGQHKRCVPGCQGDRAHGCVMSLAQPMAPDASPLTPVERTALALCTYVNTNARAKSLQTVFLRQVGTRWILAAIGRRLRFVGLPHATGLA